MIKDKGVLRICFSRYLNVCFCRDAVGTFEQAVVRSIYTRKRKIEGYTNDRIL